MSNNIVAYWTDNNGKLNRGVVAKCNGESVLVIPVNVNNEPVAGPSEWVDLALLTSVNLQTTA
jgi:hypothetical protein